MEGSSTTNVEIERGGGNSSSGEEVKSTYQPNWGNRRLYIGNISNEVTEEMLSEFFQENGLKDDAIQKIALRTGYAFVECRDAETASAVVARCNMKTFMNTVLRVEAAEKPGYRPKGAYRQRSKTQMFKNNSGGGMSMDGSGDNAFIQPNRAQGWKNSPVSGGPAPPLLDMDFSHAPVQAPSYNAFQNMVPTASEPPLKILVPNEFVGAVIGRGGVTIRQISKTTGARLDIFRNCSRYDVPEKPVTIFGPPEKASKACRRILEIILSEAEHVTAGGDEEQPRPDLCLRMFAQDSYIGRVIGKGGSIIKKIMEDTQTRIHISTQSDFTGKDAPTGSSNRYFSPVLERLITVRGTIDGMCRAEEIISEKLREAYQNEIHMYDGGYPGQRPYTVQTTDEGYQRIGEARRKFTPRSPFTFTANPASGNPAQYIPGGTYSTYSSNVSSNYVNSFAGSWSPDSRSNLSRPERVHMYIPEDVVGALIGRRGVNVRQIINQSGASVKIMEDKLILDDCAVRRVVIHGVIDSLFKAQYLIYDKVVEEGKGPVNHQIDDFRLTVEMSVPSEMVGRLIGKQGQNIREIQKNFLCRVKFMTEPDPTVPPGNPGETFVRITGNYNSFLGAQKQIRENLVKLMTRMFHGPPLPGLRRNKEHDGIVSGNSSGNSDDILDMSGEELV